MAADFDYSELKRLAADLGEVPDNLGPFLRGAMMKTAGLVKKDAAKSVGTSEHWHAAAQAIDYDVEVDASASGSSIEIEVGYNKDKPAGALGNLREYGAPLAKYGGKSVPLAPSNDLLNALEKNSADFERGITNATEDALKKAGL